MPDTTPDKTDNIPKDPVRLPRPLNEPGPDPLIPFTLLSSVPAPWWRRLWAWWRGR